MYPVKNTLSSKQIVKDREQRSSIRHVISQPILEDKNLTKNGV